MKKVYLKSCFFTLSFILCHSAISQSTQNARYQNLSIADIEKIEAKLYQLNKEKWALEAQQNAALKRKQKLEKELALIGKKVNKNKDEVSNTKEVVKVTKETASLSTNARLVNVTKQQNDIVSDSSISESKNTQQKFVNNSEVKTEFSDKKILVAQNISNKSVSTTDSPLPELMTELVNQSATPSVPSNNLIDPKIWQMAQNIGTDSVSGMQPRGNFIGGLKDQASSAVSAQGQSVLNNLFSTQRGTTEIGATTMQNGLPIYNILLVRPIWESEDKIHTTFTQISAFNQNNRTTGNFGLGYRQLVADKKVLLGTNAFYDYEFPYGNQRTSVGGEIRSSVGELNLNYYVGTSGWVNTTNGVQEKSLGGYNAELALALPYMPTTKLRANTFSWTGIIGLPNTNGTQYSITGPIWYGLNLDLGRVLYNNGAMPNSNYAKLMWIFGGDISSAQKEFKFINQPYLLESMEDRRYEKVRRENLIVKAQGNSNFGLYAVGY